MISSEKGLSKGHRIKVVNFHGGTSEKILDHLEEIIKEIRATDLTSNVNLLNYAKKIIKVISKDSLSINIILFNITSIKIKVDLLRDIIKGIVCHTGRSIWEIVSTFVSQLILANFWVENSMAPTNFL